jgi:ribosomal protein S18 acetylase RimI-like enzyme
VSEVSIERLGASEIDLVEPLWSTLREHHASVAPNLGETRARADSWRRRRAQYLQWLSEPDSFALVAWREGAVVGYAMVHLRVGSPTWPLSERAGELETLSVLPAEHGQGIGSALLDAVRERLHSLDVGELALHVIPTNADAIRFYERQGFGTFGLWLRTDVSQPN